MTRWFSLTCALSTNSHLCQKLHPVSCFHSQYIPFLIFVLPRVWLRRICTTCRSQASFLSAANDSESFVVVYSPFWSCLLYMKNIGSWLRSTQSPAEARISAVYVEETTPCRRRTGLAMRSRRLTRTVSRPLIRGRPAQEVVTSRLSSLTPPTEGSSSTVLAPSSRACFRAQCKPLAITGTCPILMRITYRCPRNNGCERRSQGLA
ncbi:hypothetical protein BKA70DRAFT_1348112 [Coprinopsis sp. MPI-PUGE-AT-0042]|nr:hypothetical protein BKA70DRAFT_1348112 [Coprinopsis sp. MPI-PUGE-AT-0042]